MSLLTQASLITTPNAYKGGTSSGKLYSIVPTSNNGDMTVVRNTIATRTNSGGLIESVTINVPRLNYDTTGACPNILLEPERINSVSNSVMTGASSAPSTNPTGWQFNMQPGFLQTVVGVGVENGLNYVDIRFNGTGTLPASTQIGVRTTQSLQIAAAQNQVWATSVYVKIVAQPLPPNVYRLNLIERNSSALYLTAVISIPFSNTVLQRISGAATLGQLGTAFVQQDIAFDITSGVAYDFTVRIAGPQVEKGPPPTVSPALPAVAYTTSFIPTVSSIVTRNADSIFKTTGVSSLIGQTEGVLFFESAVLANDFTNRAIGISDGTSANRFFVNYSPNSNQIQVGGIVGGILFSSTINHNLTNSTTFAKIAVRYRVNDISLWVNGLKVGTDLTSQALPINLSRVGFDSGAGFSNFYGKIKQFQLYKTYLTNAEMQSLTTITP